MGHIAITATLHAAKRVEGERAARRAGIEGKGGQQVRGDDEDFLLRQDQCLFLFQIYLCLNMHGMAESNLQGRRRSPFRISNVHIVV